MIFRDHFDYAVGPHYGSFLLENVRKLNLNSKVLQIHPSTQNVVSEMAAYLKDQSSKYPIDHISSTQFALPQSFECRVDSHTS